MRNKNKTNLVYEIKCKYDSMLRIGESKKYYKQFDTIEDKIFSWGTYRSYIKHANYFAQYCKLNHNCKNLEECREYINEWLQTRRSLSPYTQKLEVAALAKLYGAHATDFVRTPPRKRDNIVRSRGQKKRDSHFSELKHAELVEFCQSTGLRRAELYALTGDKLVYKDGMAYIIVDRGSKGGRYREAMIVNDVNQVINMMTSAGPEKVFANVPTGADIHAYRADYATTVYKMYARRIEDLPYAISPKGYRVQPDAYHCRNDRKGVILDKQAMLVCAQNLGHNRISVVGQHYIKL